MMKLTNLESEVLRWLLDGDDPVLEIMRKQIDSMQILSREDTGVGFYLNFHIPEGIPKLGSLPGVKEDFAFGDVGARVGKSKCEMGFKLFITKGIVDFLEGYSYGNDFVPSDHDDTYELYYCSEDNERSWKHMRSTWLQ